MLHWLTRLVRHRLFDESDTAHALSAEALKRIEAKVAASERRHSGEIRVMVEAGLPLAYLRRGAAPRDRAVAMFGKLRVWDTELNNGVLVYLLLAERAIEIVADRGLTRHVDAAAWAKIATQMQAAFRSDEFESGLMFAIDAVDALLVCHFPLAAGATHVNELPDAPVVR